MLLTALNRPRASACPGLFRIVPARDGGLCRIKIPLGRLAGAQSRAIADAARRFGSGVIEITNRANIQIRGIAAAQAAAVGEMLVGSELGPAHPDGDDIRNVMVSPTAGIDPGQIIDVRPLARALLDRVQADEACRALSPKFCFLIDGGENVAVVDHPHDIWLSCIDTDRMAIGFAGCPHEPAAGQVRVHDAADVIVAAAALFQEMAAGDPSITRLRHLFAVTGREAFVRRLGSRLEEVVEWRRRAPKPRAVGASRQRDGLSYVGAVPPLGRLTPEMLTGAADIAAQHGADEIRLAPWQGLLMSAIREVEPAVDGLKRLGLVCDAGVPLAAMIACAGAPGCSAGRSDTKTDALELSRSLAGGALTVHLSGCEKSCASPAVADITLVAAGSGVYDVFAKGAAGGENRFGRRMAKAATISDAARLLRDNR